ncbi:MAG: rhodanese-like domain-containing protein [Syntrophales bacterium]|jgi:phage shock protein E|nr:rhodanese-like domain-containing protein [Syntrophales bacterium]
MKKLFFVLLAVELVFGAVSSDCGANDANPLIIDVRTEAEWRNGHLEGAILIPYEFIGEKIGTVAKDRSRRIYVYCRSGRRSQIAKETLEKLLYKDVVNLGPLENAAKKMKRKIVK